MVKEKNTLTTVMQKTQKIINPQKNKKEFQERCFQNKFKIAF